MSEGYGKESELGGWEGLNLSHELQSLDVLAHMSSPGNGIVYRLDVRTRSPLERHSDVPNAQ